MRLEELPTNLQKEALAALGSQPRTPRDRRQARERGLPLTHLRCGFVADPATEGRLTKHTNECGGGRWEWRP